MSNVTYTPISENQHGLWLLQTTRPDLIAFNVSSAFRIQGALDVETLHAALEKTVCHHPLLRTTFTIQDETPVQCVHQTLTPQFDHVNAIGNSEEALQAQVQQKHDRPFDLETGPLTRLTVISRALDDHVVLFSWHHILLDFGTQATFTREILDTYQAEMDRKDGAERTIQADVYTNGQNGTQRSVPFNGQRSVPLNGQLNGSHAAEVADYPEFVAWQQAYLNGKNGERSRQYWAKQLQAPLPRLDLPTDRPYPAQQTYNGNTLPVYLSGDLSQRVLALAKEKNVTPFVLLLSAYSLLLAHYSGQNDLTIGVFADERLRLPRRFQKTLGYLVNVLPLRLKLARNDSFVDLLRQTGKVAMGGVFHQNYPFTHMAQDMQSKRDFSRPPIYDVAFNMPVLHTNEAIAHLMTSVPDTDVPPIAVGELEILPYSIRQLEAQVPFQLDWWLEGQKFAGRFKYNSDLFDDATVVRMSDYFIALLEGLVSQPEQPVSHHISTGNTTYQQAWDYWLARLDTLPPAPELPLAPEGQTVLNPQFNTYRHQLDAAQWAQLKQQGEQAGLTETAVILNAFTTVLTEWSKQPHFTLKLNNAAPFMLLEVDNRSKTAVSPPTFTTHAQQLQQQLQQDLDHNLVNGTRLLDEWAKHQEQESDRPLLPVAFTNGLAASSNSLELDPTVWLEHTVSETAVSLDISWRVADELFPEGMIAEMFDAYCTLLQRLASDNETWQTPHLSLLPPQQQAQRQAYNDTDAPISGELLHTLFLNRVEDCQGKTAVITPTMTLTYAQLYHRANQVGHWLRSQEKFGGVNTLVGVVMEKGWEQIVAVLGIQMAGAAYLPIDPHLPAERQHYLLAQAEANIVLTQQHLEAELSWPQDVVRLSVDTQTPDETLPQLDTIQTPTDLAYVIYTSGSTGQPKGVVIDHRGAVNTVLDVNQRYGITADDRVLALSALNFDLSVYDVFGLLALGGGIVMPDPKRRIDPEHWQDLIDQHGVTVWDTVPALMQILVEHEEEVAQAHGRVNGHRTPSPLRVVMMSGDWIPVTLPDRIRALHPEATIYSMGGATEASIWSIYYPIETVDPSWSSIPYGKPMLNQTFHVLDANFNPRPTWVPGDLYIGGIGVALGYWKDEERTNGSFVTHPRTGDRLYKTGDLGRYLPAANGETPNIEFLGREDFQVKIRGHRIELGEIEHALLAQDGVRETVVLGRDDDGDKRLVAYVVTGSQSDALDATTLRAALQQTLPDYMIPSAFVMLEAMPLTANGKVNRRALPAPVYGEPQGDLAAPRDETEAAIAQAFAHVLRVDQVGIHDNFFDLGGDSIVSIQLVSRARAQGVSLTARDIFLHQTVADLARVAEVIVDETVAAEQGLVTGNVPLLPVQREFFARQQPDPHHFNQAVLLNVPTTITSDWLTNAWQQIMRQHDGLRTRFTQENGQWQATIPAELPAVVCREVDLSGLSLSEQEARIGQISDETQTRHRLESGELVQSVLFRLGIGRSDQLLIAIHHLVIDGVSWRILLEDLQTLWQKGELPTKTTAFQQWAASLSWENVAELSIARSSANQERGLESSATNLFSEQLQAELPYWENAAQPMTLPVEKTGKHTVATTEIVHCHFSEAETTALLQNVPAAYNTQINDILLTAAALTLQQWTSQQTATLMLEGHGREWLDTGLDVSRTVGWFTSMYPLTLTLPNGELPTTIKSVKEQLRAIPLNGVGYGVLRHSPSGEQLAAQPHPPIEFNYLGQFDNMQAEGSAFTLASMDLSEAPTQERRYLLGINGYISNGQLTFMWDYSHNRFAAGTIEQLAATFETNLRRLIVHCQQPEAGGRTPSDFGLAKDFAQLSQSEVDTLLATQGLHDVEEIMPLTPMQAGMLFHSLYAPQSGVNITQLCLTVTEGVAEAMMRETWQAIVDTHPPLRTSFHWKEVSTPVQVVHRQVELPWQTKNWRAVPDAEARLETWLLEDRERGFALDEAPLLRLTWIEMPDETTRLVWTHPHLLLDGWSFPPIFADLQTTIAALQQGTKPNLTPKRAYGDYIAWLYEQDRDAAEQFWREKLAGFSAPTPLAVQGIGELAPSKHPGKVKVSLSPAQFEQLQAKARAERVTLNTVVQGMWSLLLNRYSREQEVLFGAAVAGRPAELDGVEEMVGLFINTLPVRVAVDNEANVWIWLRGLQLEQQEREQYSYTPLVDIQQWSEVPSGTALFESLLVFENYPMPEEVDEEGTIRFAIEELELYERTNYPLTIVAYESAQTMSLDINYDTHQFAPDTIARMARHLQALLTGVLTAAEVGGLSLVTEEEREQLLVGWNDTTVAFPDEALTAVQLFEEQAARLPNAPAVLFASDSGQTLTYRELDEQANQLAHYLINQGGRETQQRIAVCMERSHLLPLVILAIWKAGHVFVPLTPGLPLQRKQFILEQAGVELVLTDGKSAGTLPQGTFSQLMYEALPLDEYAWERPLHTTTPQQLAHIVFTSGTTGVPKGILTSHRNMANYLLFLRDAYQLDEQLCTLQLSSITFDAFIIDIFGTLSSGGKLVMVNDWTARDPFSLVDQMRKHEVTALLGVVPSMLRGFFQALESNDLLCETVQLVVSCGEALLLSDCERAHNLFAPALQLINQYGPTEGTACSTHYRLNDAELADPILIGQPISNQQIYILDTNLDPVPIGVAGEIYIGGIGVAQGYLNNPELTAKTFIPNPFRDGNLYKTGDLARFLPDGNIQFVGRVDHQIKLRGNRIELGEIEAVLTQHPAIQAAIVLVDKDSNNDQRLVAYLVGEADGRDTIPASLDSFLSDKLPDYMLPSGFVVVDAFPITSHGKIDRRALLALGNEVQTTSTSFVAPRTSLETELAEIWQEVLKIEQVGIHDSFFKVGGHSLTAAQVMVSINQLFDIDMTLRDFFANPTIAECAELVMQLELEDVELDDLAELLAEALA
ncbi:MAG: amino acid adenylation domain-containing protein [Chloroflexota bacterium]